MKRIDKNLISVKSKNQKEYLNYFLFFIFLTLGVESTFHRYMYLGSPKETRTSDH